jgi:citrate lyase subunit beta/citryl-CoA lyase
MGLDIGPRSVLFVPATRPTWLDKALRTGADLVVVDLEDAVAADQKDQARRDSAGVLAALTPTEAPRVFVRVNEPSSSWHADDLQLIKRTGIRGVVLPKYEFPEQLCELRAAVGGDGSASVAVMVGLESARGIADCRVLLAERPDLAYFGAEDLVADLGGQRTPGNLEVLHARSSVMLAARVEGVAMIDQAVTDIRDAARFLADAGQGRDLGYGGKLCVHPSQVALSHEVFTPSDEAVARARLVLASTAEGVALVDGEMVDEVHVKLARQVVAHHERAKLDADPEPEGNR